MTPPALSVPALAESYQMSEDGLTYTFTLKDDLKWSDGSKLDANDFVYSWKRLPTRHRRRLRLHAQRHRRLSR